MFCKNCGKEIDDKAVICIHCGVAVQPLTAVRETEEKKMNVFGIVGFILSIVAFFLSFYCVVPVCAVVFSAIGMTKRKNCTSANKLTLAGLILSIIALVLDVFMLVYGQMLLQALYSSILA